MLATAALTSAFLLASAPQQDRPDTQQRMYQEVRLNAQDADYERMYMWIPMYKMDRIKKDPLHGWEFEYIVAGYANRQQTGGQFNMRFRVYSQFMPSEDYLAPKVTRALLRLWEFNHMNFGIDHIERFYLRSVDVYLAFGGESPGGEHLFTVEEDELNPSEPRRAVNVIYIYQVPTFTDPLEMTREIAHEYGHATIPQLSGDFTSPEFFPNGTLGERLYICWIRQAFERGVLQPVDFFGVTAEQLDGFIERNVTPALSKIAQNGPAFESLQNRGSEAYEDWVGLGLYAGLVMPPRAMFRALSFSDRNPDQLPAQLVATAAELETIEFQKPPGVSGNRWWIPLGKGTLQGGTVVQRKNDWAQIETPAGSVTVKNPPIGQNLERFLSISR